MLAVVADIFATYRFDNAWKPEVTLEYVYFSGEDNALAPTNNQGDNYHGWNGLYRGKFWTAYADFREYVYATADANDQPASSNQEFIQVKGSMKPMEDLMLEGAFTYLWLDKELYNAGANAAAGERDDEIGWEIDLQAIYDYTEDVSFGLLA